MATEFTQEIDFGTTPTDEASVQVTTQAGILATSRVEAWIMGAATPANDAEAHKALAYFARVFCGVPTAGQGPLISVSLEGALAAGAFKLQGVWS